MGMSGSPGLKFLVADDSSTIRRFVVQSLEACGNVASCAEATTGDECLEHLMSGEIDIAFIDVNMPGLSGLEAVAKARENGLNTFTVIMSSDASDERLAFARVLGVYEYLSKPFTLDDVATILENYARVTQPTSVLLVDDSETTRAIIKEVLHNSVFNLSIEEAHDGPSALVAYQNGHHDIVFLDVYMPGLNGIDTLETLRKMNRKVRVALMTSERSAELDGLHADGKIDGLLYKPFYAEDVDRALHKLFGLQGPALEDIQKEVVHI